LRYNVLEFESIDRRNHGEGLIIVKILSRDSINSYFGVVRDKKKKEMKMKVKRKAENKNRH
jgi:hypothetical protein